METTPLKNIIKEYEGKNPLFILCELLKSKPSLPLSCFIKEGLLERFTLEYLGKKSNCANYIQGDKENKAWHEFIKRELDFITKNLEENSDVIYDIPAPYQFINLIDIEINGELLKVSAIRENGDLVTVYHENVRSIYNVLHLNTKQLYRLKEGYENECDENDLPQKIKDDLALIFDPNRDGSYEYAQEQIDYLKSIGYTADFYVSGGELFDFAKLDSQFEN